MVLAGIAGYVALRLFRVESRRDLRQAERDEHVRQEARRQQASAVGVWMDGGKMIAANLSGLPIYRLKMRVRTDPKDVKSSIFRSIEDTELDLTLSELNYYLNRSGNEGDAWSKAALKP